LHRFAKRRLPKAFPNLGFKTYGPYPLIAEGDYVFGRWIGGGTHTGTPFDDFSVGALDKPNSGKQMWFSGMTIFTMKDGKIVKEIGEEGGLTALQQLGLIEPPKNGREMFYDVEGI
jgi:predicted ester cyclase